MTALCQMDARSATITRPYSWALGAIQALGATSCMPLLTVPDGDGASPASRSRRHPPGDQVHLVGADRVADRELLVREVGRAGGERVAHATTVGHRQHVVMEPVGREIGTRATASGAAVASKSVGAN